MVEIELGSLLEEKLRRLVELGLYTSLSEAVRDAVRRLLREIDLMNIALRLYLSSDASFQYIVYFAETSFDNMIEYLIQHGYTPLLGLHTLDDKNLKLIQDNKVFVLDPITVYIIYKTGIIDILLALKKQGYTFYTPVTIKRWAEVLEVRRIPYLLDKRGVVEYFDTRKIKINSRRAKLTIHEIYSIEYARINNAILLSEDIRTREHALKEGVNTSSIIPLIYVSRKFIDKNRILTALQELKTIPVIVPNDIVEELLE